MSSIILYEFEICSGVQQAEDNNNSVFCNYFCFFRLSLSAAPAHCSAHAHAVFGSFGSVYRSAHLHRT